MNMFYDKFYASEKMKKGKSAYPTSSDIVNQTKQEFDNAGSDIEPITVNSEKEAEKEIQFLTSHINEDVEWDEQVNAIKRGMGLVNGGALKYPNFVAGVGNFSSSLIAGCTNLRSSLVKIACLFVSQLAQQLRENFTVMGEVISYLSKQTSHGTLIIAESCKQTIEQIAKNCPIKSVFQGISSLVTSKSTANRLIAAESYILMINYWDPSFLQNYTRTLEKNLRALLADASQETRVTVRTAAKMYISKFPNRSEQFLDTLDSRTKKGVLDAVVPDNMEPLRDPNTPQIVPSPTKKSVQQKAMTEKNLQAQKKRPETERRRSLEQTDTKVTTSMKNLSSSSSSQRRGKSVRTSYQVQRRDPLKPPKVDPTESTAVEDEPRTVPHKPLKPDTSRISHLVTIKDKELVTKSARPSTTSASQSMAKRRTSSVQRSSVSSSRQTASRRRSSPIPYSAESHQQRYLKHNSIVYEDGNEVQFLTRIQSYIQADRTKELNQDLNFIVPGLIICAAKEDQNVSNQAFALITQLLPEFPTAFQTSLPSLMEVVFVTKSDTESNNQGDVISNLLKTVRTNYDPNILIGCCITQPSSKNLVHFLASLCSQKSTCLKREQTGEKIIRIAIKQLDACEADVQKIVRSVGQLNSKVVLDVEQSVNDQKKKDFLHDIYEEFADIDFDEEKKEEQERIDKIIQKRSFADNVISIKPSSTTNVEQNSDTEQKPDTEQKSVTEQNAGAETQKESSMRKSVTEQKTAIKRQNDNLKTAPQNDDDRRKSVTETFMQAEELEQEEEEDIQAIEANRTHAQEELSNSFSSYNFPSIDDFNGDTKGWCKAMYDFAQQYEELEWPRVRPHIYKYIVFTMDTFPVGDVEAFDDVLELMSRFLDLRGVENYRIFYKALLLLKDRKTSPLSKKQREELRNYVPLIQLIESSAPSDNLSKFLIEPCNSTDIDYAIISVDELSSIVIRKPEKMRVEAKRATKLLTNYIDSENILLRKSIVFCIAAFIRQYGDAAKQATLSLDIKKQRLIALYV